jgi:hypothetical protein
MLNASRSNRGFVPDLKPCDCQYIGTVDGISAGEDN